MDVQITSVAVDIYSGAQDDISRLDAEALSRLLADGHRAYNRTRRRRFFVWLFAALGCVPSFVALGLLGPRAVNGEMSIWTLLLLSAIPFVIALAWKKYRMRRIASELHWIENRIRIVEGELARRTSATFELGGLKKRRTGPNLR
jgi:type VI protein secretion system component VasF